MRDLEDILEKVLGYVFDMIGPPNPSSQELQDDSMAELYERQWQRHVETVRKTKYCLRHPIKTVLKHGKNSRKSNSK